MVFSSVVISVVADPDLLADNNNGSSRVKQDLSFSQLGNDLLRASYGQYAT